MEIISFSSGSKGNCYLIRGKRTNVLVDAGITMSHFLKELKKIKIRPEDINGIFVTHEHTDHTKSLEAIKNSTGAEVYASEGTLKATDCNGIAIEEGKSVTIGNFSVTAFVTSHDVMQPMGFVITGDKQVGVITDTGIIPEKAAEALKNTDALILESNYETGMLEAGDYPFELKKRIASRIGHLSNQQVQRYLEKMWKSEKHPEKILLAHMSHSNNAEILMVKRAEVVTGKGFCVPLKEYETVMVSL